MKAGKIQSGMIALCVVLGASEGCSKKSSPSPTPQGNTSNQPKPKPQPQPKPATPAPAGATPKYNAPGGTSIDLGAILLDGSTNEVADDLGPLTDNSGYGLTATFSLTLAGPSAINLTGVEPYISNGNNTCTYQSFALLIGSGGNTIATLAIASTVTTDQVLAFPGTQPAGAYKIAIVLQSPGACSVDFFFQAAKPLSQGAVATGTTTPAS